MCKSQLFPSQALERYQEFIGVLFDHTKRSSYVEHKDFRLSRSAWGGFFIQTLIGNTWLNPIPVTDKEARDFLEIAAKDPCAQLGEFSDRLYVSNYTYFLK